MLPLKSSGLCFSSFYFKGSISLPGVGLFVVLGCARKYEDAEKALTAARGSVHQKETRMEQIKGFIAEAEALPDSISDFRITFNQMYCTPTYRSFSLVCANFRSSNTVAVPSLRIRA